MNTFINQSPYIISVDLDPSEDTQESEDFHVEAEWREAKVDLARHGERLDRALVHAVPEFSRSYLQQLIDAGCVKLNAKVVNKPSLTVKAGDALAIEMRPTPQSKAFKPEPMDLQVVYEDQDIFVIFKPAGLVVHPAPGNWSGTLLNGLLSQDPKISEVPRAGIVHRLDKDTSGLMVVARSRKAMDALVQAIAARTVSRQYLAVGHGPWSGAAVRSVEEPIGRDPRNRLRMAVVDILKSPGKTAKTDLIYLANSQEGCLMKCVLHTGRTHQIRVHMASIGHPLVGDTVYGGAALEWMPRQALHAFRLAFQHPITGHGLSFEAPPPEDFIRLLNHWGLSYNAPTASNPA